MKLLSLFSGIGAFEKALTKMGVDFELVNYCEIDRYASKSFAAVHGVSEDKNLGDITKVDTGKLPNDIDLLTYGFPCQDISSAGKQKGFENEDGSSTRSGLFFEALRIIEAKRPKVAIAENVKNLVSKKFANEFAIVLESLENAGYNNYWKVLNAKNYGIPQNRERVFVVSIRKDIDDGSFMFPEEIELKIRLKDLLEENVDEKYYLSDSMVKSITNWKAHQKPLEKALGQNSICQTLTARGAGENHSGMVVYSDELEETTNVQGRLLIKNNTAKGYLEAGHGDGCYITNMDTKRGTVQKGMIPTLKTSPDIGAVVEDAYAGMFNYAKSDNFMKGKDRFTPKKEMSDTVTTALKEGPIYTSLRIRKLTPKECWRLMGFDDIDVEKAASAGISNTQLYKQAGNSIVVNVLEKLLEKIAPMLANEETTKEKEENEMKKVEEKRIVTFETDKWIDIAALIEREPELFEELARDYPVEDATYIYEVKKGA